MILIFYYDILEDYVFYDGKTFYCINDSNKVYNLLYSPRFEFICEVF
jgi:hypothetical protein